MSRIRADRIVDRAATGAPLFPNGAVVTGVTTATTFKGGLEGNVTGNVTGDLTGNADTATTATNAQGLTGTPNIIVGSVTGTTGNFSSNVTVQGQLTYEDVTNVDSVGIVTARGGLRTEGVALFKAGLAEKVNVKSQLTGANACAITDGNVILTTTNEPGNTYPNITGVHSLLASGQGFSVTIALKVNGSGTLNNFQIDGQAQNIEWSGGSAPSAGSSGYDVFTFTAMKTGSGATDYTVFGASTNYD